MPPLQSISRKDVTRSIAEYKRLGQGTFLSTHGFDRAHEYVLVHEGHSYDSVAIVGVAHRYASGQGAEGSEFAGGEEDAATVLRDLGFVVRGGESSDDVDIRDASDLDSDEVRAAWAVAAREVLVDTAKSYHAVVTYKELSSLVQQMTRIQTTQLPHYWIADVLGRVAKDCEAKNEPLLSSLCVDASGSVGAGYAGAVLDVRGETPADPDQHAASERLECYRHFGAKLPAGGGFPMLTAQLSAKRERVQTAVRAAVRPAALCPVHHVEMPATGICEECE